MEKDALAIKWAKERLRSSLLEAPKFQIVTAHKSLLPLFNKTKAKMPPGIEKWVMEMQDVDFEVIYEPGKDEAGPLDYCTFRDILSAYRKRRHRENCKMDSRQRARRSCRKNTRRDTGRPKDAEDC
jgi:hypothetical protein